ncbi:MAG: hypothetical protein WC796_05005 [Candidatus Pacearchaeota archaeon]|jgi:hypothetical protein
MAKSFSLKSVVTIAIVVAVIAIALSYVVFSYMPQQKKVNLINDYKKASYEAILCQYSCPLELQQNAQNKTELLPQTDCVKNCSSALNQKNLSSDVFSANDLKNDNFFNDLLSLVNNCKKQSLNQTSLSLNTQSYVDCVSTNIKGLTTTYNYIN